MEKLMSHIRKAATLAAAKLPPERFNDLLVKFAQELRDEYNKIHPGHLYLSELQALDEMITEEYSFSCSLRREHQYA